MIWVVVVLGFPSTAVSRIGRLVGVVLIKCEFVLPTVIYQLLNDEKPDLLISIFRNASMLLGGALVTRSNFQTSLILPKFWVVRDIYDNKKS